MEDLQHENGVQLSLINSPLSSTFIAPVPKGPAIAPKFVLRADWMLKVRLLTHWSTQRQRSRFVFLSGNRVANLES